MSTLFGRLSSKIKLPLLSGTRTIFQTFTEVLLPSRNSRFVSFFSWCLDSVPTPDTVKINYEKIRRQKNRRKVNRSYPHSGEDPQVISTLFVSLLV